MSKISSPSHSTALAEKAIIKTIHGEMTLEFWPEVAPKTVENFVKLAEEGFYDGTAFHRVVKDFMIQGGDPLSKTDSNRVGTGGPGYSIKAEFNSRPHVRGVVSMARSQNPDSAGSQFFICLANASFLDGQYTAFGKLIAGDDVLDKIGGTPTTHHGGEKSRPKERMGVESIKIIRQSAPAPVTSQETKAEVIEKAEAAKGAKKEKAVKAKKTPKPKTP